MRCRLPLRRRKKERLLELVREELLSLMKGVRSKFRDVQVEGLIALNLAAKLSAYTFSKLLLKMLDRFF